MDDRPVVLFDLDGVLLARRPLLRVLTWVLHSLAKIFRLFSPRPSHRGQSGKRGRVQALAEWLYWEAPILSTLVWGPLLRYPDPGMMAVLQRLSGTYRLEIVTSRTPNLAWLTERLLHETPAWRLPVRYRPIWVSAFAHKFEWVNKVGAVALVDDDLKLANELSRRLNGVTPTCQVYFYGLFWRRRHHQDLIEVPSPEAVQGALFWWSVKMQKLGERRGARK